MEKENYLTSENINLVIEKIKEGMSVNEIIKNYNIKKHIIDKIMKYLRENNPSLYQEIRQKQFENALENQRKAGKKHNTF